MFRLKVKHKLLAIWLGSIILALMLMMGLFEYQISSLHRQSAHAALSESISVLRTELSVTGTRASDSAATLSARDDMVASMNMIDRYQDPANYQPQVFDAEKRRLAQELAQHAQATGTDIVALTDSAGQVAAYYLNPDIGGMGAGYVAFKNGRELAVSLDGSPLPTEIVLALIDDIRTNGHGPHTLTHTRDHHLVISTETSIVRPLSDGTVRTVGRIIAGRTLDDEFNATIERLTGMAFGMIQPDGHVSSALPGIDTARIEATAPPPVALQQAFVENAPIEAAWTDTDDHFIGAIAIREHADQKVIFAFAQQTDALASALKTFRNTVLVVLLVSGLLIVPIGIFFLNRSITTPVERLAEQADKLREGQRLKLDDFPGDDEFSDLAQAFGEMSDAVHTREAALRESQAGLKNAQRIARLGNWDWDMLSGHVAVSDEVYAILGRTPADLGGHIEELLGCIHPDDLRAVKRSLAETVDKSLPLSMECRVVRPDGEERFVTLRGELTGTEGDDAAPHLNATMQDITERHMLEQAKSSLISTVSHELRTPLTSITGTLGLAVGGVLGDMPEKLQKMLHTANTNAKRLSALIDDLLDIEKIASGSMTFDFLPVDVPDLLRQAHDANQAYAERHGTTIRIDGEPPQAQVLGDADRLNQVLANLLSNAAKFSPEGGEIVIRARREDGAIAISVSDTGPGIPEDFEARVFERFAQADQSLTRADQRGGTGLGLSITKSIVDMHEGQVTFHTTRAPAPGHGTTFTVTLPEWREGEDPLSVAG